jgi:hypothetical protein
MLKNTRFTRKRKVLNSLPFRCEIKPYVEKHEAFGEYFYGEIDVGRRYSLFGILADVRNFDNLPVIDADVGLPDDVSFAVNELNEMYLTYFSFHFDLIDLRWDADAHSHHWMLASTFLQWDRWGEVVKRRHVGDATLGDIASEMLKKVKELVDKYAQGNPENLRLIYWFDN